MPNKKPIKKSDVFPITLYVFASLVVLVGLVGFGLGLLLAIAGGSPFYLASGIVFLASGVQLFRGRASALHLASLNFVITWIWAFAEVGIDGWALLPRVDLIS